MSKVKDTNYLAITAMLAARETKMLSAERMERMIDAPTNEEAAKILEECGYGDLSGLSAKDAGAALEAHIAALFDEVEGMVPEAQLVQLFRLKYDYHNAKVLIKAKAVGAEPERLLLPAPGSETLNTAKLRVVRGGVLAGSVLKKRFQPAHALFMAYGAQCTNREELTLTDPRTAAWLRGEEIDAATAQNGWCAVLVDGFPLGGGKVSGGRIKNHYPKGLRNLQ